MTLKLYTKDNCFYCFELKEKLDKWGYQYEEINVSQDEHTLKWLKKNGHHTVPQLYFNGFDIQQGDSIDLTEQDLHDRLADVAYGERAECDFNDDWKPV